MSSVTILVSSCDKYEDAWEPFFRLLNKYWPQCPYECILVSETKQYNCDFLNVRTISNNTIPHWGSRVKHAVNQIDTEYILFFLEDFFVTTPVDTELFFQAIEILDTMPSVGVVKFYSIPVPGKNMELGDVPSCESFSFINYNVSDSRNVVVALWRKDCLNKMIFDCDTPWTFELESQWRAFYVGYDFVFQNTKSNPVFKYYIHPRYNLGISFGKWLNDTPKLFADNGIYNINFEKLGILEHFNGRADYNKFLKKTRPKIMQEKNIRETLYKIKRKTIKSIMKLRISKWLEIKSKKNYYKKYYKKLNNL